MKARKHKLNRNQTELLNNLYNIELHKKVRLIIIIIFTYNFLQSLIMSKLSHIQKVLA